MERYRRERLKELAYNMIKLGQSIESVMDKTSLSREEVQDTLRTNNYSSMYDVVDNVLEQNIKKKNELVDIIVVVKDIHTLLKEMHLILKNIVDNI